MDSGKLNKIENAIYKNSSQIKENANKLENIISVTNVNELNSAIQQAKDIPYSTLYFTNNLEVTDTVKIPKYTHLKMDGDIILNSDLAIPIMTIGDNTVSNGGLNIEVRVRRKTQSDFSSEDNIGVQFININSSNINVYNASNNTIGVQFLGDTRGVAYNQINLYYIYNNKIGVDLTNLNSGWCNENLFLSTRVSVSGSVAKEQELYGVRITSKDGSYTNNNNNVFIKPSFEMFSTHAIPVKMEHGIKNCFLNARTEDNGTVFAYVSNNSCDNIYHIGYNAQYNTIIDEGTKKTDVIKSIKTSIFSNPVTIFNSGNIIDNTCYYDSSNNVNIARVHIAQSTNGKVYSKHGNITINDDNLLIPGSRGIGLFVDTTVRKRFLVRKSIKDDLCGRVSIRCYDSEGNILDNTMDGHPYVYTVSSQSVNFQSLFGGVYMNGTDVDDYYFMVSSDVKKIAIILNGGSNGMSIKSFSIVSLDGDATVWCGYEEIIKGVNLAIEPPTSGEWRIGKKIINPNIASGQIKGWVYDGTTWLSEGTY